MKLNGNIMSTLRMSNSVKRNIWPRAAWFKSVYPLIQEQYFTLITPSVSCTDSSREAGLGKQNWFWKMESPLIKVCICIRIKTWPPARHTGALYKKGKRGNEKHMHFLLVGPFYVSDSKQQVLMYLFMNLLHKHN